MMGGRRKAPGPGDRGSSPGWRALRWAVLATLGLFVAATASGESSVRVAGSAWVGDAATKVAEGLDLFNPPGRSPHIAVEHYGSGKAALAALLAGEVEFALTAPTPLALEVLEFQAADGDPEQAPVVLASLALSNQSHPMVADRRRGIGSPADLEGRRVGLPLDTSAHYGWSRFVAFNGLDESRMTLVDVPVERLGQALEEGQVDLVVGWDPWTAVVSAALADQTVPMPGSYLEIAPMARVAPRQQLLPDYLLQD